MTFTRRSFLSAGAALAASSAFHLPASAQTGVTRIVVGFTAGTTPDVLGRRVAEHLAKGHTRAAVVDNRAGAGGQLAVAAVKEAAADGSTILLTPMSMLGVYPHTYDKLPYDPVADLAPVSTAVSFDYGIGVGPSVPESVKTIPDLIAWYKANPDQATMASPATGSTLHFVTVMLGRAGGVDIRHVGYRGSTPAIQDMLGGVIPALCTPLGTFLNQPKLRVLATCGAKRSPFTPDVPTLAEQGFADIVYDEWYGFFLPAKASPDVVKRLNGALHEALADPAILETLATFGMEAAPSTPEQLAQALKVDLERWGPIVRSIGFKANS